MSFGRFGLCSIDELCNGGLQGLEANFASTAKQIRLAKGSVMSSVMSNSAKSFWKQARTFVGRSSRKLGPNPERVSWTLLIDSTDFDSTVVRNSFSIKAVMLQGTAIGKGAESVAMHDGANYRSIIKG